MEALFKTAFDLHTGAVLQRDVAERLIAEEQQHLQAAASDETCLQDEGEIDALIEERVIRQVAVNGLPAKKASFAQKVLELEDALRILRLPEDEPAATLVSKLPARAVVSELKRLQEERTALDSALRLLRDALVEAGLERDTSAQALADHEVLETTAELQTVVEAARRMGDLDVQVERACGLHAERVRQAEDAVARLLPWAGDAATLRRLAIPVEDILQAARDREFAAATILEEETQEAGRLREELARRSLERDLLLEAGNGVSAATVADARKVRDACWVDLRAHLEGRRNLASPPTEADRFQGLAGQADQRADERFLSAEASGRLAQVDAAVATAELHLTQAVTRVDLANEAQHFVESLWLAELTGRSLPVFSVARLREWLTPREATLEAVEQAEAAAAVLHADEATLNNFRQALGGATAQPPAIKSFRRLLDDAEAALKNAANGATALAQLRTALQIAEGKVLEDSRKVDRNLADGRAWQEKWKQVIARTNLDEAVSAAELDTVELVRATATVVQQLREEIENASSTQEDFLARLQTLLAALQMPAQPEDFGGCIERLKHRLYTARANRQRIAAITLALETREGERRTAEAQRISSERSLEPLLALAGVEELTALSEHIEESKRVRKVLDEIDDLKQMILSLGDGVSLAVLIEEAEGQTPDELALRSDGLAHKLTEMSEQIRNAADLVGVSRTNFEALDHGASASDAASDAEMARAELDVQAEAYLLKRTETLLLRWAIERRRRETQNPLLLRAGQLFSTLTGNRYCSLTVDDSGDSSVLLGNCSGEPRAVPVANMSEGTIDQLYLALRIASIEQSVQNGSVLPVLADDLFINFDDGRAEAGFRVLGELAKSTQVLFFTHHQHLLDIARRSLHPHETRVCNLVTQLA